MTVAAEGAKVARPGQSRAEGRQVSEIGQNSPIGDDAVMYDTSGDITTPTLPVPTQVFNHLSQHLFVQNFNPDV